MALVARAVGSALLAGALLAPAASAAPTLGTPVDVSDQPGRIARGPDGNVWVLLAGGKIAKITPAGAPTEYADADLNGTVGLTAGSDGNLWATKAGAVVKIPPADPTTSTEIPVALIVEAQDIVTGRDGALWTGSSNDVVRVPPANPAGATQQENVLGPAGSARGIASGGDGRLYVANFGADAVTSVSPTGGEPISYPVGSGLQGIAAGPGNQVAYTQPNAANTSIGRISPGGPVLKTNRNGGDPFGITLGPDGAYWIAQFAMGTDNLARLTPGGEFTTPIALPANSGPRRIAAGAQNTLWVSLESVNKVAVVRGVDPPQRPGGGGAADRTAPTLSAVDLTRRVFAVGKARTPVSAAAKRGTTIKFRLSEAGTVRIRIDRKLRGRRSGRTCVKPRPKLRGKRLCTRYKRSGKSLVRIGKAGANSVRFSGRIGRKALRRGRYRLTLVATDAAGNRSKGERASFRIVRAKKARKRR